MISRLWGTGLCRATFTTGTTSAGRNGNGYSHVRASTLGPSSVVPFSNRALLLGMWQQIIVVNFDNRRRSREIVLQIMGEQLLTDMFRDLISKR
jgi:hypothetical protein